MIIEIRCWQRPHPQDTLDLLKLGDRYMLEHLKSLCERYLKKYIDIENFTLLFEVRILDVLFKFASSTDRVS